MIGFVLAAGLGTRLRPLTDTMPKAMVNVCGRPLLEHALLNLKSAACDSFLVNVHYLPEVIRSYQSHSSIPFEISDESERIRGTGGAIFHARDILGADESFCVVNADILSDGNLKVMRNMFELSKLDVCLVAARTPDKSGTIRLTRETMYYAGTPSKPITIDSPEEYIGADFIGTAFYRQSVLEYFTEDDFSVVPVWQRLVEKGLKVGVLPLNNLHWRDTGTPEELLAIHRDILNGTITLPVANHISIDPYRKIAMIKGTLPALVHGDYAWIETSISAPAPMYAQNVLVYAGVNLDGSDIRNCIIAPHCTIHID